MRRWNPIRTAATEKDRRARSNKFAHKENMIISQTCTFVLHPSQVATEVNYAHKHVCTCRSSCSSGDEQPPRKKKFTALGSNVGARAAPTKRAQHGIGTKTWVGGKHKVIDEMACLKHFISGELILETTNLNPWLVHAVNLVTVNQLHH